jgi:hypothetical protein
MRGAAIAKLLACALAVVMVAAAGCVAAGGRRLAAGDGRAMRPD